ncbi:hypothetical protein MBRA1_001323 [Malassezia brasiliensis]|uniref:Uncharacterized protein n=1 Tax=Malassezia brasiliensis TaxID=1821822 RepID=A0AAF0DVI2_9BASI|nr:hypothetical protein MBRA1_001323 [Malassezia brasiliensis]
MADEEAVCVGAKGEVDNMGVRIGAIFIIFASSAFFTLLPIVTRRIPKLSVPGSAYDFCKYFGSGVIIATGFIHLLEPASDELSQPCLAPAFSENYPMAYAFALISMMLVFICEFFAYRLGSRMLSKRLGSIVHHHASGHMDAHEEDHHQHEQEALRHAETEEALAPVDGKKDMDLEVGSHLDEGIHSDTSELIGVFVLEFGVIFHSVIIGLTLATTDWDPEDGDKFVVLFPVIVFHQLFEGIGLGSRLSLLPEELGKWMPIILGLAYSIVTPVGMAIGLGLRHTYTSDTPTGYYVTGIFDAFSAGILIYTGLVELLAHDFVFNSEMQKAPLWKVAINMFEVCLGAGIMALLGRWA